MHAAKAEAGLVKVHHEGCPDRSGNSFGRGSSRLGRGRSMMICSGWSSCSRFSRQKALWEWSSWFVMYARTEARRGEELLDVGGRLELRELGEEFGGEILGVRLGGRRAGMTETKTGAGVQNG